MGLYSVAARLGPDARAAWTAWQDATLDVGAHLLDCGSGCDDLLVRCVAGMLVAEEERQARARWQDARNAEDAA